MELAGITVPSFRKLPPATIEPAPITQPSMIVAPMPIRQLSPISQPCSVTWWVIEQFSPTMVGVPEPTWIITKSWMLVRRPIITFWLSARTTTLHQIEASGAISTAPKIRADGSIQAEPWSWTSGPRKGAAVMSGTPIANWAPQSAISQASDKPRPCQTRANRA